MGRIDDLDDPAVDAAISEGLRRAGMGEDQREMVRVYLDAPPDPLTCCGSACSPCVVTLGFAVTIARRALGLPDAPDDV